MIFLIAITSAVIASLIVVSKANKVANINDTPSDEANAGAGCAIGVCIGVLWLSLLTWIYNIIQ